MSLVWFEYEWMLEDIKENQKEKQTQAEAQEKQHKQMERSMRNPYSNFKMPQAPAMPKFSMPKF